MKILTKLVLILVTTGIALSIASCQENGEEASDSTTQTGKLMISINENITTRTLLPGTDMIITSFTVIGVGPGDAGFNRVSTDGQLNIDELAFGDWELSVEALNSSGTVIGRGTGTTTVHTNETAVVSINVLPNSGTGSLDLSLLWPANEVDIPQIRASLLPTSGASQDLEFIIEGSSASYSSSTIDAGYYTLNIELLDNGYLTMGAVEVVRIVEGDTTTGLFDFSSINQGSGSIQVNISTEMADPIEVTMTGAVAQIDEDETLHLSATVPADVENVSYVWYINGTSVATGPAFDFVAPLYGFGVYRVDVTAISADGTRAGSTNSSFEVAQLQESLMEISDWTYYGSQSGTYLPYSPAVGVYEEVSDGLLVYGSGYRRPGLLQSNALFDCSNIEIHYKWKANGPSGYYAVVGQIQIHSISFTSEDAPGAIYVLTPNCSLNHSYNNSALVADDTWYYTRIEIIDGVVSSFTASDNYDDTGGTVIKTYAETIVENELSYFIGVACWDNYGSTASNYTVGEFTIDFN